MPWITNSVETLTLKTQIKTSLKRHLSIGNIKSEGILVVWFNYNDGLPGDFALADLGDMPSTCPKGPDYFIFTYKIFKT